MRAWTLVPLAALAGCVVGKTTTDDDVDSGTTDSGPIVVDTDPPPPPPDSGTPGSTTPFVGVPLPYEGLWLVVHPSDAPGGPGIVHIDGSGNELARLPLPAGCTSPHGLAYDGVSLWLTDMAIGGLHQIDPTTGAELSVLPWTGSEGVALDGAGGFWLWAEEFVHIDASGAELERRGLAGTVQDVAFDGTDVLYLTNGYPDTVTRIAPDGTELQLAQPVTRGDVGYAMMLYGPALYTVDQSQPDEPLPYGTQVLRTVDPWSGQILATSVLPVEGWITAIAPDAVQL
jgi:hypothetical protein